MIKEKIIPPNDEDDMMMIETDEDLDILSQRYYKDNYEYDEEDYDDDQYIAALEWCAKDEIDDKQFFRKKAK